MLIHVLNFLPSAIKAFEFDELIFFVKAFMCYVLNFLGKSLYVLIKNECSRGGSETKKIHKGCRRPVGTHFDSLIFCESKSVFRVKFWWKLAKTQGFFEISAPLKFNFSKISKIITDGTQIDQKFYFYIQKFYNQTFFDKTDMWEDMTS